MPETEEARLEECKWISSQIKMIDAQANRAQFTQTTKYARLARESADASISLLGVAADHSCARFEIDFDAMSCARCRIRLSQIDSRISGA